MWNTNEQRFRKLVEIEANFTDKKYPFVDSKNFTNISRQTDGRHQRVGFEDAASRSCEERVRICNAFRSPRTETGSVREMGSNDPSVATLKSQIARTTLPHTAFRN